ncbi:bacterial Ig-like domain-containing protein [Vagococcus carniphilus]|uniref:Ig-like domain-containing protein n=1 Tax=Vagococcus carniphilus TaxID=218144 RepID=A0A430AWE8_9ENTE|nr:bacterial Ig-like domain-containing protein [Vagococcus carniphilus]QNN72181.1 bacterial Ig-like domain-containing protein [Vagococcus carniphilus]RSU12375.1 hypothetical protein CBF28_11085 [Vagococcus carniphilus]
MKKFKTFIVVALLFFVISPVISFAGSPNKQATHGGKEVKTSSLNVKSEKVVASKETKDSEADVIPAELNVVDSSLSIGDKWDAKNNFVSVVMSNGANYSWDDAAKCHGKMCQKKL